MITAIDSNVIIGLWNADDTLNPLARKALEGAFAGGSLVICGAVFGELIACPGRTEQFINRFLEDTEITVDWTSNEVVWRTAGTAFQKYANQRRKLGSGHPRRILTDFYIGAHALVNGYALLTLDDRIFRPAFPKLNVINA